MNMINDTKVFTAKEIKAYGYREIDLSKLNVIVELDRDDDANKYLEKSLCDHCNISKNNHYGFKVILHSDKEYFILFEDNQVWVAIPDKTTKETKTELDEYYRRIGSKSDDIIHSCTSYINEFCSYTSKYFVFATHNYKTQTIEVLFGNITNRQNTISLSSDCFLRALYDYKNDTSKNFKDIYHDYIIKEQVFPKREKITFMNKVDTVDESQDFVYFNDSKCCLTTKGFELVKPFLSDENTIEAFTIDYDGSEMQLLLLHFDMAKTASEMTHGTYEFPYVFDQDNNFVGMVQRYSGKTEKETLEYYGIK